jgi:hypothetical protein
MTARWADSRVVVASTPVTKTKEVVMEDEHQEDVQRNAVMPTEAGALATAAALLQVTAPRESSNGEDAKTQSGDRPSRGRTARQTTEADEAPPAKRQKRQDSQPEAEMSRKKVRTPTTTTEESDSEAAADGEKTSSGESSSSGVSKQSLTPMKRRNEKRSSSSSDQVAKQESGKWPARTQSDHARRRTQTTSGHIPVQYNGGDED